MILKIACTFFYEDNNIDKKYITAYILKKEIKILEEIKSLNCLKKFILNN